MSKTPTLSPTDLAKLGAWLLSHDTGISSLTIAGIAMGAKDAGGWGFDAPHDWADFGRCKRLVARVPALRDYLPTIAKTVPQFAGIVEHWDELCALYAKPSQEDSSAFYRRITELRGDRAA